MSLKFPKQEQGEKPKKMDINCVWCDAPPETCYHQHCEDPEIKFLSGGGIMSGKINHKHTAWGCWKCDQFMSKKPVQAQGESDTEFEIRFMRWQLEWRRGLILTHLI